MGWGETPRGPGGQAPQGGGGERGRGERGRVKGGVLGWVVKWLGLGGMVEFGLGMGWVCQLHCTGGKGEG